jgi:predicted GIY-YIG superfamily endonuclease
MKFVNYFFACCKRNDYIYILELECNKWYVGRTRNIKNRILDHKNGNGSEFTKKYKMKSVHKIKYMKNCFDEDNTVKEYMMLYGIDNVRGGTYSSIVLNQQKKNFLIDEFNHYNNCCFKCGMKEHYIKDCINVNNPQISSDFIITFGKYKNKFIKDVPQSYINWCRKQNNPGKDIVKLLERIDQFS